MSRSDKEIAADARAHLYAHLVEAHASEGAGLLLKRLEALESYEHGTREGLHSLDARSDDLHARLVALERLSDSETNPAPHWPLLLLCASVGGMIGAILAWWLASSL